MGLLNTLQAMASCHSLIKLRGELTGNPLDVKGPNSIEKNSFSFSWKNGFIFYSVTCVTVCGHRMAHMKWKETKQQPGTARPGNMLGCCLVSSHFL